MSYRKNYTLRLDSILSSELDNLTLDQVIQKVGISRSNAIDIFIEEPYLELTSLTHLVKSKKIPKAKLTAAGVSNIRKAASEGLFEEDSMALKKSTDSVSSDVLLFLKMFDPSRQRLEGFCHVIVKKTDKVSILIDLIRELCPVNENDSFYEEFQPDAIEPIENSLQFVTCELVDGDILAFSSPLGDTDLKQPRYPSLLEYYDYLRYRIKITLTKTANVEEEYSITDEQIESPVIHIWISAKASYKAVSYTHLDVYKRQILYLK